MRKLHGTDVSSSAIYTAAFPVYGGHPDAASVVANIGANATILWPNTQVVLQPNTGQVAVYSHGTLEQQFEALNTPADTGQQPGQFVQVAQQDIRDDASAVLPESMGVPIYKLLEIGSVVVGLLSAASIVLWLLVDTPLVHPAVSLMLLVASPLGYLMGRAARKQLLG